MPAATTSIDGYLTSTNFNTFNNKQPAGSYATLTGTEILTNKSISGGQITSAVANATLAASVTTNANLTGVVTSTGNATLIGDAALSIAKTSGLQTALDIKANLASPTFTGTVTAPTFAGALTGNAATVTTNANLTGLVTSTGNTTSIADAALSIAKTSGLQTALDSKLNLTGGTLTGALTGIALNSITPAIFISKPGETTYGAIGVVNIDASNGGLRFYSKSLGSFIPVLDLSNTGNATLTGTLRATNFGANIAPNINFGYTGAASTSTSAPFLISGGVAYTGTQAGALWYENTNQRIRFFGATATDLIKSDNNFLLEGLSVRVVTANPVGGVVAVTPIIEQFTTVAEVITAITGATYSSNRATITPASSKVFLKGQFYDDGTFTYLAISDNSVRRF
jgi:hypothetical protein